MLEKKTSNLKDYIQATQLA